MLFVFYGLSRKQSTWLLRWTVKNYAIYFLFNGHLYVQKDGVYFLSVRERSWLSDTNTCFTDVTLIDVCFLIFT